MTKLSPDQYAKLLEGIHSNRVSQKQGQSHVEAWDIRRHLIRIFGFGGFDIETIRCDLVKEIESPPQQANGKSRWTVVYRAEVRLTIKAPDGAVLARYEDGATGDAINMPSIGDAHDFAMKTALSQALKRCAVNLGDQFGLALYNGGKTNPVVLRSLVAPTAADETPAADLPVDDAPVLPEPGPAPADEQQAAAASAEQAKPTAPSATSIRDWVLKPRRTTTEILEAKTKLLKEHPPVAAERIENEHGDQEQLVVFMARRAREANSAPPPSAGEQEDKRRKRMFALFRDLGFDGDANREQRHKIASHVLRREVTSMTEVVGDDQETVIKALEDRKRANARQQRQGAAA